MNFDVATVLALSAVSALLSAVVLGLSRARESVSDVREAVFSSLALSTGFLLQLSRDVLGEGVAVVAANTCFWLGATYIHRTCRRFVGPGPQPRWPFVVIGVGFLLFVGFILYDAPYGVRALTTSVICVVLCTPALVELGRDGGLGKEPSRRIMFGLLFATTLAFVVRSFLLLPHLTEGGQFLTPALERTLAFVPSLVFSQGFGLALVMMHLERSAVAARELALRDALTGCFNRRALETHAEAELGYAARHLSPCALLIVDLDHFKKINDGHGHATGDQVLAQVGALLRDAVRPGDFVARYGGEEFCILLREATAEQAEVVAERLRIRISKAKVPTTSEDISPTASLGVAGFDPNHAETWRELFHRADEALYSSKQGGRDRVTVAPPRPFRTDDPPSGAPSRPA